MVVVVVAYIYIGCIEIGEREREREKREGGGAKEREGWREGWRRTAGSEAERGEGERRVQLRVGRRSVCQSFVWTSRLTRPIVCSRSGIVGVRTARELLSFGGIRSPLGFERRWFRRICLFDENS